MVIEFSAITRSFSSGVDELTPPPPGENDRHFVDDIFRWMFKNDKNCILIGISLNIAPVGPIYNNPALG